MTKKEQIALTTRQTSALARTDEDLHRTVRPSADIVETDEAFVVKLDVPGTAKNLIEISLLPTSLRIKAPVQPPKASESSRLHREIQWRTYVREFRLGDGIDRDRAEAEFEDGVLTIILPKREETKSREIPIR